MKEVDWNEISMRSDLSLRFIKKHADALNWRLLIQNIPLTDSLLKEYEDYIDWADMIKIQGLPQRYLDIAYSHLNNEDSRFKGPKISRNLDLPEDRLMQLYSIDFDWIAENRPLSSNFLIKMANKLNWFIVSQFQNLEEEVIETVMLNNPSLLNSKQFWSNLVKYQVLSEDFLRRHFKKIDFFQLSSCQKLSETFIEDFSQNINWNIISCTQELSDDFIVEHKDILDWSSLCRHQSLSESTIERYSDKVDWEVLSAYRKMPDTFWEQHSDKFKSNYLNLKKEDERKLSAEEKRKKIKLTKNFECFGKYFLGYLVVRPNGYRIGDFRTQYRVGETYTEYADPCQIIDPTGILVLSKKAIHEQKNLLIQPNTKLLKVKIKYEDFSSLMYLNSCAICSKIVVLEEL